MLKQRGYDRSWQSLTALALGAVLAARAAAQDAPFPTPLRTAQPNSPTTVRPRSTAGLAPVADPVLEPIPPSAPAEFAPRPEFPAAIERSAAPRLPSPPLLPTPRDAERLVPAAHSDASLSAPAAAPPVVAPPIRPTAPLKLPPPGRSKAEAGESSAARSTGWGGSIVTVLASLGIVLGLFAIAVWLMRRGLGGAAMTLPSEAVCVLGQLPLTGRQQILLVRVGPKLLLVSTNGETSATLTEIESEGEVDRIVGLCAESQPHSATQTFRSLLSQMSSEPAAGGFLGESHRHPRDLAATGPAAHDD